MANEAKQFTIGGVTHDVMDVGARQAIASLQNAIDAITSGDTTTAIKTFQEVINFLDGVTDDATLIGKLNELRMLIAAKYSKPNTGIPASDLADGVIPDVSGFATKTEVNAKANSADVVPNSRTINGKALSSNVTIGMSDIQGLVDAINNAGSGAVSVTTNQDGTFTIHVGETDYTINLNHEHEGMVKLDVSDEDYLPDLSEMDDNTIYAGVADGEISVIYIGGYPFHGGGGEIDPDLRSPANGSTIDVGDVPTGSSVSKVITIKANTLITESLNIAISGTGYAIQDNVSSISAADAKDGKQITILCSNTSLNAAGTLTIQSSGNDGIDAEVYLVANKYEALSAVKLNGTQWLETDYYPNPNTEFSLEFKLTANSMTEDANTGTGAWILRCQYDTATDKRFTLHNGIGGTGYSAYSFFYMNKSGSSNQKQINMSGYNAEMVADHAVISYVKGASAGTLTFNGGTARSVTTALQTETLTSKMCIGYNPNSDKIYNVFDLTIYEFTITEGGTEVRHWLPKLKNGVPGLYDTVNRTFIRSKVEGQELVAIY